MVSEQVARAHPSHGFFKVFSQDSVKEVLQEYAEAKALGSGAAEEWVKGLEDLGKSAMSDATRWLRWEEQLPIGTDLPTYLRDLDAVSFPPKETELRHASHADNFGPLAITGKLCFIASSCSLHVSPTQFASCFVTSVHLTISQQHHIIFLDLYMLLLCSNLSISRMQLQMRMRLRLQPQIILLRMERERLEIHVKCKSYSEFVAKRFIADARFSCPRSLQRYCNTLDHTKQPSKSAVR